MNTHNDISIHISIDKQMRQINIRHAQGQGSADREEGGGAQEFVGWERDAEGIRKTQS